MENVVWLAAVIAALAVFALVAWRLRAPARPRRAAPRDPRLAHVNGPFDAANLGELEARLTEAFRLVLASDAQGGGFAVVEHGSRYVQLGWGGGTSDVMLEAVSIANLPRGETLDAAALDALAALGFAPPEGGTSTNHWQRLEPGDASPHQLARVAAEALEAIGAPPPGRYALTTELEE